MLSLPPSIRILLCAEVTDMRRGFDGLAGTRVATPAPSSAGTSFVERLPKLGVTISRSSVRRILIDSGVEPAPERLSHMPWSKFLRAHWSGLAAADFFATEVWTSAGLVRYWVLFVIDLSSRRVEVAGVTCSPDGEWTEQIARNLVDDTAGFLRGATHLIIDRDPLFTRGFAEVLEHAGVTAVRLPPQSPNLNAYAERFVLSIKSECLNRLVLLGEHHLRRAIDAYVAHYHQERPHQGLGNRLVGTGHKSTDRSRSTRVSVGCSTRIDGLREERNHERQRTRDLRPQRSERCRQDDGRIRAAA